MGRQIAEKVLASLPTCPIPEIKRLGARSSSGEKRSSPTSTPAARPTAAQKQSTASSLLRRIARGFRNREHYRLRMLLIGGGLTHPHLR